MMSFSRVKNYYYSEQSPLLSKFVTFFAITHSLLKYVLRKPIPDAYNEYLLLLSYQANLLYSIGGDFAIIFISPSDFFLRQE